MRRPDLTSIVQGLAPVEEGATPSVRIGVLADFKGSQPLVDFPGNRNGPLPARSMVPLDPAGLGEGAGGRREVVLLFEEGDPCRPIIAGFLEPAIATPALEASLEATFAESSGELPAQAPLTAEVDGRRLLIDGRDEVVIRCGESSITLRRNGKVVIRGLYVETHAAGTNRIKGGSVKIN
jgi:Domain of unknown function (DUF6484)